MCGLRILQQRGSRRRLASIVTKTYLYDLRANFYYCNREFTANEAAQFLRLRLRIESRKDRRPLKGAPSKRTDFAKTGAGQ